MGNAAFLRKAIENGDSLAIDAAFDELDDIERRLLPLELLHRLLLLTGHSSHQQVAFELQKRADRSSVPVVRKALEKGFHHLEYTCSEDAVIAKWFSHLLSEIGSAEAIALLREQAESPNTGIAEEMKYRLKKMRLG